MVPPRITSPMATGSMYWSIWLIQTRLVGATYEVDVSHQDLAVSRHLGQRRFNELKVHCP
jgi:hypothetical protein